MAIEAGRLGNGQMAAPRPTGKCGLKIALHPDLGSFLTAYYPPAQEDPQLTPGTRGSSHVHSRALEAPFPMELLPGTDWEPGLSLAVSSPGLGRAEGRGTFTAPSGVAPENAMLLLDEVPAQDDVLPSLRILPAHSGEEGQATVSTGGTQCTPATAHWPTPPPHRDAQLGSIRRRPGCV